MSLFYIIKNMKTKEETDSFIKKRLEELQNDESVELGYNTDINSYDKFLGKNVKLDAYIRLRKDTSNENPTPRAIGRVVLDDDKMFEYLIDAIKETNNPYDAVFLGARRYLFKKEGKPTTIGDIKRTLVYKYLSAPLKKTISIKRFNKNGAAMCSEIAGVSHNMFKFLNIESDFIMAASSDNHPHTFNIIYPEGRKKSAVIFDPIIIWDDWNHPVMFQLDELKKRELLAKRTVNLTDKDVLKAYRNFLRINPQVNKVNKYSYRIYKDTYPDTLLEEKRNEMKLTLKKED